MVLHLGQALAVRRISGNVRRQDAAGQRRTIMVGEDADWLLRCIGDIGNAPMTIQLDRDRSFVFLSDDAEVVLTETSSSDDLTVIEAPQRSVVSRVKGSDLDSWVYRITMYDGTGHFEVAFRKVGIDHLLYLHDYTMQ